MTPLDLSSLRGVSWKTTITKLLGHSPTSKLNTDRVFSFDSSNPLYLGHIPDASIKGIGRANREIADDIIREFAIQVLDARTPSETNAINPIVIYTPISLIEFDYDWLENQPEDAVSEANILLLVPAHSGRNTYVSYYWGTLQANPHDTQKIGIDFFALGGYIGTTILQQLAKEGSSLKAEISCDWLLEQVSTRWASLELPSNTLTDIVGNYYSGVSRASNVLKAESFIEVDSQSLFMYSVGVLSPDSNLTFPSSVNEKLLQAKSIPNQSVTKTGTTTMKLTLSQIIEQNKDSAIQAGKLEAGRTVNQQLGAVMAKSLPLMVRGYAQTELGHLVVANLFLLAVQNFANDNKVAMALAESAVNSASYELLRGLDIPKLIDDVVKGVPSAQLSNLLTKGEE